MSYVCVRACVRDWARSSISWAACWHAPVSQCQANTYSTATNVTALDTYLTHRHSFPAHIQSGIGKPIAITIECVNVGFHQRTKKWLTGRSCSAQIRNLYLPVVLKFQILIRMNYKPLLQALYCLLSDHLRLNITFFRVKKIVRFTSYNYVLSFWQPCDYTLVSKAHKTPTCVCNCESNFFANSHRRHFDVRQYGEGQVQIIQLMIPFSWFGFWVLILCTLAHHHNLLGHLNITDPSLMLRVTPAPSAKTAR